MAGEAITFSAEPQLFTTDIGRALAFYVDKLGFNIAFQYGEPPFYAQVERGGARLNLRLVHGPVFDPTFRQNEGDALSATLTTKDAAVLARDFAERGARFHQALTREEWGAQTFIIADPDGNLLCFAGRAESASAPI